MGKHATTSHKIDEAIISPINMKVWTLVCGLALAVLVCWTTPVFSNDEAADATADTTADAAADAKQTCDNPDGDECKTEPETKKAEPSVRIVTEEELAT
jgi:hypothetical protein